MVSMLIVRNTAFLICLFAVVPVVADDAARPAFPGVPAPPRLDAAAYLLLEFETGTVLAAHNERERAEPASLTKIMTTYVAADAIASGAIALDDITTVSEKAWRMEGSRMFIEVGKQVSVDELLQGVIVQSGNDASVALAEYVSGSETVFASVMNQHAERMGMQGSRFANATGLPDPDTYVTPYDLAILARHLIRDFPDVYARFSQREYTYADITQPNRNRLLARDASADGIKTGHTEAAGYCLVSSATRNGMRLIAVVMGAGSDEARTAASQALLNYGFRFFETKRVFAANTSVATPRVWKGVASAVDAGLLTDLVAVVPRGSFDALDAAAEVDEPIVAPVTTGQTLGRVVLTLDGEPYATHPLVALEPVAQGSIVTRAIDGVMLWFE